MKIGLLVLTAALSFGVASAQTAPQAPTLTDVPAGHWAKDAIDLLIEKGIILGYPDGTYRGSQNLTRYEAAVIIARLLDQMKSSSTTTTTGMDQETVDALNNAIQELSADLAALGVRVSDIEENSVSKEEFTQLQDQVASLIEAMNTDAGPIDDGGTAEVPTDTTDVPADNTEALDALQAQLDDLSARMDDTSALDDLQAQLDDLSARMDDTEAVDALQAQLDDLSAQIGDLPGGDTESVDALQTQLDELTARVDDYDYDTLRADVDDDMSSIAALNDLTVLLNQDVLDLQDRVGAVEMAQTDLSTSVTALQNAPKISLSGSINTYYGNVNRVYGSTDFDIARLTTGTFGSGFNDDITDVDTAAYSYYKDSAIKVGLTATNLSTTNGAVVINKATVNFGVASAIAAYTGNTTAVTVASLLLDGTIAGQKLGVNYNNKISTFKFNDYLFNNMESSNPNVYRRGTIVSVEATSLPLQPTLTAVAGYATVNKTADAGILEGQYYGLRAAAKVAGGTVGVSFAQNDSSSTLVGRSALGSDWDVKLGQVSIKGAAVGSVVNQAPTFTVAPGGTVNATLAATDWAIYTKATADFGPFKVAANYRAIDPEYRLGDAGMSVSNASTQGDSLPYAAYASTTTSVGGQKGFGVAANAQLNFLGLTGYFDQDSYYDGVDPRTRYGIGAGVELSGFRVGGFYNYSNNSTTKRASTNTSSSKINPQDFGSYQDGVGLLPLRDYTSVGGIIGHFGDSPTALVKDLTVIGSYFNFLGVNASQTQLFGDYKTTMSGVTIAPFARYSAVIGGTDTTGVPDYTTVKYGIKLSTQPFDVALKPSVFVNYAGRNTSVSAYDGSTTPVFAATTAKVVTESLFQVGVASDSFLLNGLKAKIGYSSYTGSNVTALTVGADSAAFKPQFDHIYSSTISDSATPNVGSATGSVNGIFGQLDWNGLVGNYGIYEYNDTVAPANNSTAHAFKVSYEFKF